MEAESKSPLILIVDDIPRNLQVLSSILNSEGYQIAFAANGAQAISVCESTMPDLILLDIMMPDMDGYEVCMHLKSNPSTADIPVVFLTGKAESEDLARGFEVGGVDYITKPFNSIELLSRVRTHLDLKFAKDALIQKNNELLTTQAELKSTIAAKDKFFSIIAHDLRGPFSGFLGLSELLANDIEKIDQADAEQIADSMHKAARRLFEFLENLLEWSRSQMGRITFIPVNLSVREAFNRALVVLLNTATQKNITLVNNVSENIYAHADGNMLNTVIRNLITNAIKFSHEGGEVIFDAEQVGERIIIRIKDNGVGISRENLSKLFKLDSKLTTYGTKNESGTGLGLILCKELIERQGGSITATSKEGHGSEFIINLPHSK